MSDTTKIIALLTAIKNTLSNIAIDSTLSKIAAAVPSATAVVPNATEIAANRTTQPTDDTTWKPAPDYLKSCRDFEYRFPGGLYLRTSNDGRHTGLWGETANGYFDYIGEWRDSKAVGPNHGRE